MSPPRRRSYVPSDFWARVDSSGECWLWQGSLDKDGYGLVNWEGKLQRATRVAFRLATGGAARACVCHTCDNPPCVRPEHLFEGTHRDNVADCTKKGRRGRAKLSPSDVLTIRAASTGRFGEQSRLARQFGVAPNTIHHLLNGGWGAV